MTASPSTRWSPPALYDRSRQLRAALREAAAVALSEDLLGSVFADYADRQAAYAKIRATKVRIAGAPRGTWAGIDREFRRPDITSDDAALTMIVKQARAVYLDRLLPVVTDADICEHPALYPGVSRNAYLLLTSHVGVLDDPAGPARAALCGRAVRRRLARPSRIGFVMAHEFMHVTAHASQWNQDYVHTFLDALPGLDARRGHRRRGRRGDRHAPWRTSTNESVCASASQLFCGRVGWMPVLVDEPPPWHPPANMRGDNICQFLRTHFAS